MSNWQDGTSAGRSWRQLEDLWTTTRSGAVLPTLPSDEFPTGKLFVLTTDNSLWRSAGTSWGQIRQPGTTLGNRVSILGDSTTGGSAPTATNELRGPLDILGWAAILAPTKVIYKLNAGVSGNTSANMLSRVTDVTNSECDVCVLWAGTNDAGTGVPVATYTSNMSALVNAIQLAGIKVVLCTIPPQPTTPVSSPTRRRLWDSYNTWLAAFANRNDIPLVPFGELLIDPTTGGYTTGLDGGDGIHPSISGAKIMGQAVANVLSPILGSWSPPLAIFQTVDALDIMPGGLFLTDIISAGETAGDGVADGYAKTGANVVGSLVADAAILGNWQRMQDSVSEFHQITPRTNVTTGFAVGDKIAMCCRYRNDSVGGTASLSLGFVGGGKNVRPISSFTVACPSTIVYIETLVPPGTTAINIGLLNQSTTQADCRMAQLRVVNLTALGL